MTWAPYDSIHARWFIPESLSTERRQLSKVEADLKDKIINVFNGTSSFAFFLVFVVVFPFVGHLWQRYTFPLVRAAINWTNFSK